jgi:hypothetical protein
MPLLQGAGEHLPLTHATQNGNSASAAGHTAGHRRTRAAATLRTANLMQSKAEVAWSGLGAASKPLLLPGSCCRTGTAGWAPASKHMLVSASRCCMHAYLLLFLYEGGVFGAVDACTAGCHLPGHHREGFRVLLPAACCSCMVDGFHATYQLPADCVREAWRVQLGSAAAATVDRIKVDPPVSFCHVGFAIITKLTLRRQVTWLMYGDGLCLRSGAVQQQGVYAQTPQHRLSADRSDHMPHGCVVL